MQRSLGLVQLDEIYLSHFHADHFLGLPGLLKTYDLMDRDLPLKIHGPPGLHDLFATLRRILGRTRYPLQLVEVESGEAVPHEGYEVRAFAVEHRVATHGYAIVEEDRPGRFDPEEARRLGVREGPDFGALQQGRSVKGTSGTVRP